MRSSLRLLEKCFVRYNAGFPRAVDFQGSCLSELLQNVRSTVFPNYAYLPIEHLQLFKPNEQTAIKNIEEVSISDYQTEKNPLVLKLKPRKIKIDDGFGDFSDQEVSSENHLKSLLANANATGLLSPTGIHVTTFFELIENSIYRLSIPKAITIYSSDPSTKSIVTYQQTFYSQQELREYLSDRNFSGIFASRDFKKMVNFYSIVSGESYYGALKEQSIEETLDEWIKNEANVMEEEALLASKDAITKLLSEQKLNSVLIEKSREFKNGRLKFLEWDGVFYAPGNDTLYLIECKHSMKPHLLLKIVERRNGFTAKLQESRYIDEINVKPSYRNIVGIACSGGFPEELRKKAEEFGLLTLVPSGDRYMPGTTWTLDAKTTRKS
jgi:hypothetical protein